MDFGIHAKLEPALVEGRNWYFSTKQSLQYSMILTSQWRKYHF